MRGCALFLGLLTACTGIDDESARAAAAGSGQAFGALDAVSCGAPTHDTCFGAVGSNCDGFTDHAPCNWIDEKDHGKGMNCQVSVGSEMHDTCCSAHPAGEHCGHGDGEKCASPTGEKGDYTCCSKEWDHAQNDFLQSRQWTVRFDPTVAAPSCTSLARVISTAAGVSARPDFSNPRFPPYLAPDEQAIWDVDAENGWCKNGGWEKHDLFGLTWAVCKDRCWKTSLPGWYCGGSRADGFQGGDEDTLYQCVNGKTAGRQVCHDGCTVGGANADSCAQPVPPPPLGSAFPCKDVPGHGYFCGGSRQYGFGGGDPSQLFHCQDGENDSTSTCAHGCVIAPMGTDDYCFQPGGSQCIAENDVRGVDVSSNVNADLRQIPGLSFAFARASGGNTLDRDFPRHWQTMASENLVRGSYHFFYGFDDGAAQARTLLAALAQAGGWHAGDLPPVIDVEECSLGDPQCDVHLGVSASRAQALANLRTLLDTVENALGRPPMIYTDPYTWQTLLGGADFSRNPLWIASPSSSCPPRIGAWGHWTFIQDSWQTRFDTDRFNGSRADLLAFAGHAPPVTAGDPCAGAADGIYCGDSSMDGFGASGNAATLYFCKGHRTTQTQACGGDCVIAPSGSADYCTEPTSTGDGDPCAGALDGVYCGSSTVDGFAGDRDAHVLTFCKAHVTTSVETCSGACQIAPPGLADYCLRGNPCSDALDGVYCGQSTMDGFAGGALNTIYDCHGKVVRSATPCSGTCRIEPSGTADRCD